jgi:hypothetical protein
VSRRRSTTLLAGLSLALAPSTALAGQALYSLSIGYNGRPAELPDTDTMDLRYADDDALAVHELARTVARRSIVLTLPDRSTQARYRSSSEARPPSLAELTRALAELRADIEQANRAGDEVTVWFFYSGHGWVDAEGRANLALAGAPLSQDMLHDQVLPALPGRTVHLMLDACHAEAMLRSRDVTAETVEISPEQVALASLRSRLAHLPHVGVLMASARDTQAHEWDDFQTGVFTHELLSGLRGGADVNGDGRVEYSELAAFLAAANRGVADPRARLTTLVLAPTLYPRVAIIDTRTTRPVARLRGRAHHLGRFQVDDEHGNRLLDLWTEPGFAVSLLVPAGARILLASEKGEAAIVTSPDAATNLETIALASPRTRARGTMGELLRRGLFATAFGPAYYQGFVDNAPQGVLPVELAPAGALVLSAEAAPKQRPSNTAAWSAFAASGLAFAVAGACAFGALDAYRDYQGTNLERPSSAARDRYATYGTASLGAAAVGVAAAGLGYWLWDSGGTKKPR